LRDGTGERQCGFRNHGGAECECETQYCWIDSAYTTITEEGSKGVAGAQHNGTKEELGSQEQSRQNASMYYRQVYYVV
jgi:hypothetical protein